MNIKEKYGTKEMERDFGPVTFGSALESFRKCEELTLREFSARLEISVQNLCDLEKGRKVPSASRAAKIARIIGEPESYWIQLAFQDTLRKENFTFKVKIEE